MVYYLNLTSWLFIVSSVLVPCWAARILALVPVPLYSHQAFYYPLWKNLSQRGHQLTIYTTHPMNDPALTNVTEVDLSAFKNLYNFTDLFKYATSSFEGKLYYFWVMSDNMPNRMLKHDSLKQLINSKNERFDLVMVESIMWSFYAFGKKFNAPLIVITSLTCSPYLYFSIGNPEAYLAHEENLFNRNFKLMQRLQKSFDDWFSNFFNYYCWRRTSMLLDQHFGKDYSNLYEHFDKISMLFENTNNVLYKIRPLLPSVVQIGGLNLYNDHPNISQTLQLTLDNSKNGFIYVSLGSTIDENEISTDLFLETFRELPYTVLWKNNNEDLPDMPSHVHVSKWFPQFNILKHKNIKVFVTQAGSHSILEGIYNEVPMIGLPVYLDQFTNSDKLESLDVGVKLDFNTLNKEQFKSRILEVAKNLRYKENVKKLSRLLKDEPRTGLDKAVFWTEYVIRHNGTPHFNSPLLNIPYYQYYLLDVLAVVIFIFLVIFYIIKSIVTVIKKSIFGKKLKKL